VAVAMMRVGVVAMGVLQRLVNVRVYMRLAAMPFGTMGVLVVFIMRVRVRVGQRLVDMHVTMSLSEV
jgi:hypothetical protein